jgi:hypothetical protein
MMAKRRTNAKLDLGFGRVEHRYCGVKLQLCKKYPIKYPLPIPGLMMLLMDVGLDLGTCLTVFVGLTMLYVTTVDNSYYYWSTVV